VSWWRFAWFLKLVMRGAETLFETVLLAHDGRQRHAGGARF
jgi:hypothetical protein